MTWTLEELAEEHQREVIGTGLRDLLTRVVLSTAPTYPPAEYSQSWTWDQAALEDVLQDWVTTRLLDRGDLARIMSTARSLGALRRILTVSFSQFLINGRRKSAAANVYKRTLDCLKSDPRFQQIGKAHRPQDQLWCLAEGPSDRYVGTLEELVRHSQQLSDDDIQVVRYGPHSLKSSPILRNPQIPTFLLHLFKGARGALELSEIAQIMRHRFNLVMMAPSELDSSIEALDSSPLRTIAAEEIADSVKCRLSQDDQSILVEIAKASDDLGLLQERGLSKSEAAATIGRTMGMIADLADDPDEASRAFGLLIESLFVEGR